MPTFIDVINNYTSGTTGTLTTPGGETVGYQISGNATTTDGSWGSDDNSARVFTSAGTTTLTATFDQPVNGLMIEMYGSDSAESYSIVVDGVVVNLNTLIANGSVTFTAGGTGNHYINASGNILSSGTYNDGSIGYLQFNIPITSLGVTGASASGGGFDYFEIGFAQDADVVCFCSGTLIATPEGQRPVESLSVGDLVETVDHGSQPIRWIGSTVVSARYLEKKPALRPIIFRKGSLGTGLPVRDLRVSPQHRILARSAIAERMFAVPEVLVAAKKFVGAYGVEIDTDLGQVEYWHILLDRHELLLAEGAAAESLHLGAQAVSILGSQNKATREALERFLGSSAPPAPLVRTTPALGRQVRQFVRRHSRNRRPFLDDPTVALSPRPQRN